MSGESVFRILFWVLLAGVFGVRWYFSNKARTEKRSLMPDKKAIEQEGRGLFAFRLVSFFAMMAVFVIYALNPTWTAFLYHTAPYLVAMGRIPHRTCLSGASGMDTANSWEIFLPSASFAG